MCYVTLLLPGSSLFFKLPIETEGGVEGKRDERCHSVMELLPWSIRPQPGVLEHGDMFALLL